MTMFMAYAWHIHRAKTMLFLLLKRKEGKKKTRNIVNKPQVFLLKVINKFKKKGIHEHGKNSMPFKIYYLEGT